MSDVAYLSTDRTAVLEAVRRIPRVVARGGAGSAVMRRVGLAALGRIERAFVIKARGGTDEAGDRWQPLSPRTVAYGRRGRTRAERGRAARPSQALSTRQQARWWDAYRRGLAIYRGDKGRAAARAWLVLKGEGAVTLFDKYGHRSVEILRDTGLLLNSLSPGTASPDRVFRAGPGMVAVGTNRAGAAAHHRGRARRLPQRRLWPPPARWPAAWWRDILEAARGGVLDAAAQLLRNAR